MWTTHVCQCIVFPNLDKISVTENFRRSYGGPKPRKGREKGTLACCIWCKCQIYETSIWQFLFLPNHLMGNFQITTYASATDFKVMKSSTKIFALWMIDHRLSIYSVWWINCVPNSKSNQCATQVELYGFVVESLTYNIESYMCNSLNVLTILKCNVHNLSSSEFQTHQLNVVLI